MSINGFSSSQFGLQNVRQPAFTMPKLGLSNLLDPMAPANSNRATAASGMMNMDAGAMFGLLMMAMLTMLFQPRQEAQALPLEPQQPKAIAKAQEGKAVTQGQALPQAVAANPPAKSIGIAPPPLGGKQIHAENFESGGLSKGTGLQNWTTDPNSAQFVNDPLGQRGKVMKINFNRKDVTSSTRSRVEITTPGKFQMGKEYSIQWGVQLDKNYQFDSKLPEIIGQIHQSSNDGSPPFAILLKNNRYVADIRGAKGEKPQLIDLGEAKPGQWENWRLDWKPVHGGDGYYQLYKDGKQVLDFKGSTAFNEPDAGYFKLGIYKWGWASSDPSDVTNRTLFIDGLQVAEK